jgi:exosortase
VKKYFLLFFFILIVGILIFYKPLFKLAVLSSHSELYSHFFFIPIVSIFFFVTDRKKILAGPGYSLRTGILIMTAGLFSYGVGLYFQNIWEQNDYLSVSTFGFILWVVGGFILTFGYHTFCKLRFPLLFLLFMVPIPSYVLYHVISVLQVWSAHAVQLSFELIGFSYLRDGMFFEVPGGVAIEVARQCSGIRSSIALLITSVIAGYMFLESKWRMAALAMFVLPITIFKNALRITSLTLLASYLDKAWLTNSWLHQSGGIVYFSIAFCLLGALLWALKRSEKNSRSDTNQAL